MLRFNLTLSLAYIATFSIANSENIPIQPIQVCNDNGTDCAGVETFSDYTNKIWAQDDKSFTFRPTRQLNNSTYLNLNNDQEVDDLLSTPFRNQRDSALFGNGAYDMWFVDSITTSQGPAAGIGTINADGTAISDDIIDAQRVDTVAHELGHNFGLNHSADDRIAADRFLMAPGSIRMVPSSLSDITPDGKQLDRLDIVEPSVTVDTIGSTPFQNNEFFDAMFKLGAPSDLSLTQLRLDLSPANAFIDPTTAAPGAGPTPFGLAQTLGLSFSDVSVEGDFDGSQELVVNFLGGAFSPGDSVEFGVDIDLFSNIDGFGATPSELMDVLVSYEFSNGLKLTGALDELVADSQLNALGNIDKEPLVYAEPEPLTKTTVAPIPLPAAAWYLLSVLGLPFIVTNVKKIKWT